MNEVYVITGITDPYEDERTVLAVVENKEQAEIAECYYNNLYSDVEIERSKIVHFNADKIYYKICFKTILHYTEERFCYGTLDCFSFDKIYGSYQKSFQMQYQPISYRNNEAEHMITGFFTVKEVPIIKAKKIKLIIDFINNNFTEFTEKYGEIEYTHFNID